MRDPQEILKELYLDMTKTRVVLSKHEFHEFKTWLQINQHRCEKIRYSDDKIEFPYFAVDRTVTLKPRMSVLNRLKMLWVYLITTNGEKVV